MAESIINSCEGKNEKLIIINTLLYIYYTNKVRKLTNMNIWCTGRTVLLLIKIINSKCGYEKKLLKTSSPHELYNMH